MPHTDPALQAPPVNLHPGPEYQAAARLWQGIPGLETVGRGRLYACWYSGGKDEGPENYVPVVRSDDGGKSWSAPLLVIDPPGQVRAYDPCLWADPQGRLWLFWAQSEGWFDGRAGVWAIRCDDPHAETLRWSAPRRLTHGVMMNKPTVTAAGDWLLPTALWQRSVWMPKDLRDAPLPFPELDDQRRSNVLCSRDNGETFELLGGAEVPERVFDEHMFVQRRDGSLWVLVRTIYGTGESFSTDGGRTWSPGRDSGLGGPCSRLLIRRLHSGRLLLVNHRNYRGRNNLTAMLSDDDGATWNEGLLLDGRDNVSYPDGTQEADGLIRVIYDRERQTAKEILMASFREEDVVAGKPVTPQCRLQQLVNRAGQ